MEGQFNGALKCHIMENMTVGGADGAVTAQQGGRLICEDMDNCVVFVRDLVHELQRLFDEMSRK